MTKPITFHHAGDLDTDTVSDFEWRVGNVDSRFQEIALCETRVVGAWLYQLHTKGSRRWIESDYTEVAPRFRKRGIAIELWRRGVARWNPTKIEARAASNEGRWLLARMWAEFSYTHPELWLGVTPNKDEWELWHEAQRYAAEAMLKRLGEATREKKVTPLLTAIAGGKT